MNNREKTRRNRAQIIGRTSRLQTKGTNCRQRIRSEEYNRNSKIWKSTVIFNMEMSKTTYDNSENNIDRLYGTNNNRKGAFE